MINKFTIANKAELLKSYSVLGFINLPATSLKTAGGRIVRSDKETSSCNPDLNEQRQKSIFSDLWLKDVI